MKLNNFYKLAIAVAVSEAAGIIGSFFTVSSIPDWYDGLVKPELNPPGWLFAPVWTTLYALMGIAAFLVWRRGWRRKEVKAALVIFSLQLFLNAGWSIIFFGLKNPAWALVDIVALWFSILWTMILFYSVSRPAALLLVPYIIWVGFAAYLNYSIWILNIF